MNSLSKLQQFLGFVGWLVLSYSASAIGALGSFQAQRFYGQLIQPSWAPPPWVFGPVWSLLFTMMAVAAWLVWRKGGFRSGRSALIVFVIQLLANTLWSWLFFAWQLGGLAFVDIVVLWFLIAINIVLFWRMVPMAGALLIPYLAWVSFAAALNLSLWLANPTILS